MECHVTAANGFARVGTIRIVKRTGDFGVYMSMTRLFPYKSGGAGVFPGEGMSSTRPHVRQVAGEHGDKRLAPRYKNREIM
jgi:hypothetical protein